MVKSRGKRGVTRAAARAADRAAEDAENTTDVRTAQIEMKMPDEDRRKHYREAISHENALMAKARDRIKKLKKSAESEGLSVSAIGQAIAIEKGDPVKWRQHFEQLAAFARDMGNPFQISVFDKIFDSPTEQAKFEGRAAAQAGRSPECRWPEGTTEFEAYSKEYALIQAHRVAPEASQTDLEDAIRAGRAAGSAEPHPEGAQVREPAEADA